MGIGQDSDDGDIGCLGALCCSLRPKHKSTLTTQQPPSSSSQQPLPVEQVGNAISSAKNVKGVSSMLVAEREKEDITLLQRAFGELSSDTKAKLESSSLVTSTTTTDEVKGLSAALVEVVRKNEDKYKETTPKLKIDGKDVLWRNYAKSVVAWMTIAGDIGMHFAPAPASIVWSAVKTILETNVRQCDDLAALFGSADLACRLFTRGAVFESVYLPGATKCSEPTPDLHSDQDLYEKILEDLGDAIVRMYKAVLELLCHANGRFGEGQTTQFLRALSNEGQGQALVTSLFEREREFDRAIGRCAAFESNIQRQALEKLHKNFNDLLKTVNIGQVEGLMALLDQKHVHKELENISPISVRAQHLERLNDRVDGTCEWLLRHSKFQKWESSESSMILWLKGPMGAGKSFLASKVIDHYSPCDDDEVFHKGYRPDQGLAYFYCDRRWDATTILRSFMRQLAQVPKPVAQTSTEPAKAYIHKDVLTAMNQRPGQGRGEFSLRECNSLLGRLVNSYPRTVLILDGLDECIDDEREHLLDTLAHVISQSSLPVKIFIASRSKTDIEAALHRSYSWPIVLDVSEAENGDDIERYIRTKVDKRALTHWSVISVKARDQVVKTIRDESHGMFRWAYLQWEQLKRLPTEGDIIERLGKLPRRLTDLYQELYDGLEGSARAMLQRAVKWMKCAREIVTTKILLWVIRMEVDIKRQPGRIVKISKSSKVAENHLETIFQHLITKSPSQDIWRLSHASVGEYFEEVHKSWVDKAREEVAVLLVSNLIDRHAVWVYPSGKEAWGRFEQFGEPWAHGKHLDVSNSLQMYITRCWHLHVQEAPQAEILRESLELFFGIKKGSSGVIYQRWADFVVSDFIFHKRKRADMNWSKWSCYGRHRRQVFEPFTEPLFGVCALGFHELLRNWSDDQLNSSLNNDGLSLLGIAATFGHYELCSELIKRGCNVNYIMHCKESVFGTAGAITSALNAAAYTGNCETAKLLLDSGAVLNSQGCEHSTLCRAVDHSPMFSPFPARGILHMADLLLDRGAHPDTKCPGQCEHGSAMVTAIRGRANDTSLVELFLKRKAKMNSDNPGNIVDLDTLLAEAAYRGALGTIQLLILYGADVNAPLKSPLGCVIGAALVAYEPRGHEVIKYLIEEAGADASMVLSHPPDRRYTDFPRRSFRTAIIRLKYLLDLGGNKVTRQGLMDIGIPEGCMQGDKNG